MPFALILFAVLFITAGVKGCETDLYNALKSDFTGDKNFFIWIVAVVFIVAIGNIKEVRPVSNAFLGLIIIVIIIQNGKQGLFQNFLQQVKAGTGGGATTDPIENFSLGALGAASPWFQNLIHPSTVG